VKIEGGILRSVNNYFKVKFARFKFYIYICNMVFIIGFVLGAVAAHWYHTKDKGNDGKDFV